MRVVKTPALGFFVVLVIHSDVLSAETTRERPNVMLIITDSMTNKTMAPETQCLTPHLDKLAAEGVRLHRFYTSNPAWGVTRDSRGASFERHGLNGC